MKALRYIVAALVVSVASADTYYEKTTIPPTIAANKVLGNGTSATAAPQQLAVGTCSTSASALIWTTNTGFGCNTSINAGTLGGATFAAPGAIGGGTPAASAFTTISATGVITSTLATGTAPFTVASTTNVANLNASTLSGKTHADPGPIGSGTPSTGAFTILSATGAITSTLADGSAPLVVTSTTNVANLNASSLSGATFASPGAIGSSARSSGLFTTLGANALITGTLGTTISGAAISLNDSSNFNTTINTGSSTGTVTIGQNTSTPSSIVLKGPVSFQASTTFTGASWGLTSPVWNGVAMTLNDTTASGTVTNDVAYSLQVPNFTSTGGASTTVTNASTLYVAPPTCSGGLVCTNLYALNVPGKALFSGATLVATFGIQVTGSTVNLNASSNNAVNIGTGSTNANVSIGNGANLNTLGPTQITTGTVFTLGNFSGCSTTNGTPTTLSGGPQGGSFVTASAGTTCSVVITINGATGKTASHGWACWGSDITSAVVLAQSATSTTTCTMKGTIAAITDTVVFMAMGY